MKKKNFLLLGIFVALLTFIGSMQAQQAKDYFNFDERGEAYFSFKGISVMIRCITFYIFQFSNLTD